MPKPKDELVIAARMHQVLQAQIEQLKTVTRQEIADRIKEAESFGDLSNNVNYQEAIKAQAELDRHIERLEDRLNQATVFDNDISNDPR